LSSIKTFICQKKVTYFYNKVKGFKKKVCKLFSQSANPLKTTSITAMTDGKID